MTTKENQTITLSLGTSILLTTTLTEQINQNQGKISWIEPYQNPGMNSSEKLDYQIHFGLEIPKDGCIPTYIRKTTLKVELTEFM